MELVCGCCPEYLRRYRFDGSELVYSDPRYLKSVRKSPAGYCYRYDYEITDHVRLLELLKGLPCAVMISGYGSELYEELLSGWNSVALQVMNQAGVVTERVWFNFTADRVHWSRYTGRNFTNRQRIKRKAHNWGRRYRGLPHADPVAVLGEMMAAEVELLDGGEIAG